MLSRYDPINEVFLANLLRVNGVTFLFVYVFTIL